MILLKYTQYNKKSKIENKFYIIAAVCLLLIGGASWFALSQLSTPESSPSTDNSSYKDNPSSYNDNTSRETEKPVESAAQPVESQPYSSKEETVSKEVKSYAMPIQGEIIKDFNDSQLQYSKTYGDMRLHLGVDIACSKNNSVSSCSNGKVISVEENTPMGTVITIDHEDGLKIKYASIEKPTVKSGDTVKTGDILGYAGTISAECADEFHIHIEAYKNDKPVSLIEVLDLD